VREPSELELPLEDDPLLDEPDEPEPDDEDEPLVVRGTA
jgi:hypothetical protein